MANNLMGGPVPSCQTYKLLSEDPSDIKLLSQPQKDKYELRVTGESVQDSFNSWGLASYWT